MIQATHVKVKFGWGDADLRFKKRVVHNASSRFVVVSIRYQKVRVVTKRVAASIPCLTARPPQQ